MQRSFNKSVTPAKRGQSPQPQRLPFGSKMTTSSQLQQQSQQQQLLPQQQLPQRYSFRQKSTLSVHSKDATQYYSEIQTTAAAAANGSSRLQQYYQGGATTNCPTQSQKQSLNVSLDEQQFHRSYGSNSEHQQDSPSNTLHHPQLSTGSRSSQQQQQQQQQPQSLSIKRNKRAMSIGLKYPHQQQNQLPSITPTNSASSRNKATLRLFDSTSSPKAKAYSQVFSPASSTMSAITMQQQQQLHQQHHHQQQQHLSASGFSESKFSQSQEGSLMDNLTVSAGMPISPKHSQLELNKTRKTIDLPEQGKSNKQSQHHQITSQQQQSQQSKNTTLMQQIRRKSLRINYEQQNNQNIPLKDMQLVKDTAALFSKGVETEPSLPSDFTSKAAHRFPANQVTSYSYQSDSSNLNLPSTADSEGCTNKKLPNQPISMSPISSVSPVPNAVFRINRHPVNVNQNPSNTQPLQQISRNIGKPPKNMEGATHIRVDNLFTMPSSTNSASSKQVMLTAKSTDFKSINGASGTQNSNAALVIQSQRASPSKERLTDPLLQIEGHCSTDLDNRGRIRQSSNSQLEESSKQEYSTAQEHPSVSSSQQTGMIKQFAKNLSVSSSQTASDDSSNQTVESESIRNSNSCQIQATLHQLSESKRCAAVAAAAVEKSDPQNLQQNPKVDVEDTPDQRPSNQNEVQNKQNTIENDKGEANNDELVAETRHPAFQLYKVCGGANNATQKQDQSKKARLCGLIELGEQLNRLCNLLGHIESQQQAQQAQPSQQNFFEMEVFIMSLSEEVHAFLEIIKAEKQLENILSFFKEEKAKKIIKQALIFERISVVFIAQNLLNKDVFFANFKYLKGIMTYAYNNYINIVSIIHNKLIHKQHQFAHSSFTTITEESKPNPTTDKEQAQSGQTNSILSDDENKFIQLVTLGNNTITSLVSKQRQKHVIQFLNQIRQNNEISISSFKTVAKNDKDFYSYILTFLKNTERPCTVNQMFTSILQYLSLYLTLRARQTDQPAYVNLPYLQTSPSPYLAESTQESRPYTLVLDLDETLIHYSEAQGNTKQFAVRPYVQTFLQQMGEFYEIVVFTAGMPDYANWVINTFDTKNYVQHRLYRQHTIQVQNTYIKDLSRIGRDLSKIIIIDNLAENFQLQPDNGIFIREWTGDPTDTALQELLPLLKEIAITKQPDVRLALKSLKDQIQENIINGVEFPHLNLKL